MLFLSRHFPAVVFASPNPCGLSGRAGSGDLGLMDGDIFGQLGGGMMMPQQHSAPYGCVPPHGNDAADVVRNYITFHR